MFSYAAAAISILGGAFELLKNIGNNSESKEVYESIGKRIETALAQAKESLDKDSVQPNLAQLHKDYITIPGLDDTNKIFMQAIGSNKDEQLIKVAKTLLYYEWISNATPVKSKQDIKYISEIWLSHYKKIFDDKDKILELGISTVLKAESFNEILTYLKNAGATVGTIGVILLIILPAIGVGAGIIASISIFFFGIPGGQLLTGVGLMILIGLLAMVDIKGKYLQMINAIIKKQLDPDLHYISLLK